MAEAGFDVLRSLEQVDAAERELHERGLVRRPGALGRLRRDRFRSDPLKSWDVLRTLDAVLETVPRDAPVLDIGSFASAIPPALADRRLHGRSPASTSTRRSAGCPKPTASTTSWAT